MNLSQNCEVTDFSDETLLLVNHTTQLAGFGTSPSRPLVSVQVVTALLATLLVSLRSNVAAAARRSVGDLLTQLSRNRNSESCPLNYLIYQELILQVVIGVGKLDALNSYIADDSVNVVDDTDLIQQSSEIPSGADATDATEDNINVEGRQSSISGTPSEISESPNGLDADLSESSEFEGSSPMSGFQSEEIRLGRFSAMSLIAAVTANGVSFSFPKRGTPSE